MRKAHLAVVLAFVSGLRLIPGAADPVVPEGYIIERYATGLGAATALALGPDGLLYITDYARGQLIRRTASGTLEVVASGLPNSNALAILPSGRIFAGANSFYLYEIVDGVPRLFASGFSYISSMALKGGDLYVSHEPGIAKVSTETGTVTTALGGLVNPFGVSFDGLGDMYFLSHARGEVYTYNFVDPPRLLANVTAYGGTYTGVGFNGHLFWGDYRLGTLFTLKPDGTTAVFATGFVGANPPSNGPNALVAQGDDAIFVADGPHVWRIARVPAGPRLTGLTLRQSSVAGCKPVAGTITLSSAAPPGGLLVTLSDTLSAANVPTTLNILAGTNARNFVLETTPVLAQDSGTISATLGGLTLSQNLTVRPMGLLSLSLSPSSVAGSNPVDGTAKLECAAAPGPITVDLGSSNPAIASPVAASLVLPQGLQSVNFNVATTAVQAKSYATISGTANGITKSKTLNVTSAASVSPTSLKFGNVPINTTSVVLSTTLYNKGAVSYVIDGITLTGTNAKYYAQTNNCGGTLEAGASCTIGVTFTPTVTGSRSAKLSIATSATSMPLSVSLSGTGVVP